LALALSTTNSMEIRWNAVAGKTYQVQSTPRLANPAWTNVSSSPVIAAGEAATWIGPLPVTGQQFYRVLVDY
jgi:hypothetical protein